MVRQDSLAEPASALSGLDLCSSEVQFLTSCLPSPLLLFAPRQVFYRSNPAREAFVELCEDTYVQKMTFDSYLYKVRPAGERLEMSAGWQAVGHTAQAGADRLMS